MDAPLMMWRCQRQGEKSKILKLKGKLVDVSLVDVTAVSVSPGAEERESERIYGLKTGGQLHTR